MAITEAFPGPSAVVDSLELRKNLAGLIVRDTAGVPRAGVFPRHANALVSSTATMSVNVAAFEAALVRTGPLFVQNDGTVAVTIATAPVSNSRIDVVWARQPENGYNGFADGSNTPLISVTAGTAAASPVKPAIPAGALELATVTVPAGATATNGGGVVITNTYQCTAAAGGVVRLRNQSEQDGWTPTDGALAYRMDTTEYVRRVGGVWDSLDPESTVVSLTTFGANWSATAGYAPYLLATGRRREIFGAVTRAAGASPAGFITIPLADRPAADTWLVPTVTSAAQFAALVATTGGALTFPAGYGNASSTGVFPLAGVWYTA